MTLGLISVVIRSPFHEAPSWLAMTREATNESLTDLMRLESVQLLFIKHTT